MGKYAPSATYSEVVDAIRQLGAPVLDQYSENPRQLVSGQPYAFGQRALLTSMVIVGDSLTSRGLWPDAPKGWGQLLQTGAYTNFNAAGQWVADGAWSGTTPGGTTASLQTDGLGNIRLTVTGQTPGAWVDVRDGGFVTIPSHTPTISIYLALVASKRLNVPAVDAMTTGGIVSIQELTTIVYPTWLRGMIGPDVDVRIFGISGDDLNGVSLRLDKHIAHGPDALVLHVGTNDTMETIAQVEERAQFYAGLVDHALEKVPMVYIGGLFPRSGLTDALRSLRATFSEKLRSLSLSRRLRVRYWDGYQTMANPTINDGTGRPGAMGPDGLHCNPYGAYLGAAAAFSVIKEDWTLPLIGVGTRGASSWNPTSRTGSIMLNPTLKGSGGVGSGTQGITGPVPTSWTASRPAGAAQTLVISSQSSLTGQDQTLFTVANAAAAEYHELTQFVAIPAGLVAGDYVQLEVEMQIMAASNLATLQVMANLNASANAVYMLQQSRALGTFAPGVAQPPLSLRSDPMLITPGATTVSVSMRIGGPAGCSGAVAFGLLDLVAEK